LIITIVIIFLRDKINKIKIVPIIVGHLTEENVIVFSRLLHKYFKDESSFFIFSSEFCILKKTIPNELFTKYEEIIPVFFYRDDFIKVIILIVFLSKCFLTSVIFLIHDKRLTYKKKNFDTDTSSNNVIRILLQVSFWNE
jgi:hypothetical protein